MTEIEWPSIRSLGAPRYTVEDFAEPEVATNAWGWWCRGATVVVILFAITAALIGMPVTALLALGSGAVVVGVAALVRGGLTWAWLPSSRGGVVALVAGVSVLLVAVLPVVTGPPAVDVTWIPAAYVH